MTEEMETEIILMLMQNELRNLLSFLRQGGGVGRRIVDRKHTIFECRHQFTFHCH